MQDFRKLTVWHSSQDLAVNVYRATRGFPSNELYGLTSQMRRSAVSIGSNIAEACGRDGPADFMRFLHFAIGSVSELLSQVDIADRLLFLTHEQSTDLLMKAIAVKKQVIRLRESANQRRISQRKA